MKLKSFLLLSSLSLIMTLSGCSESKDNSNSDDLKSVQKYGVLFNEDDKGNVVNYEVNGIDSMSAVLDSKEILNKLDILESYISDNKLNFINKVDVFYKAESQEGYHFLLIDLKSDIDLNILNELNLISNHMMGEYSVYEPGVGRFSVGSTKYLGKKVYDILYTINNSDASYISAPYVIGNTSVDLFKNFSSNLSTEEYVDFLKYSINLKENIENEDSK